MSEDRKECHVCENFNKCNENVSYESNYCNVHRKQMRDKNVANLEDDVKKVKRYLENSAYKESESDFFKNGGWEMVDLEIPQAMANILAERERDKKWIREKQEMDKKYVVQLTDEQYRKLVEVIEQKTRKHFEQKARDKIEELKKEGNYKTLENPSGRIHFMKEPCDYKIDVLQELLGGEKINV